MNNWKRGVVMAGLLAAAGCASVLPKYTEAPQILPQNIRKVTVSPFSDEANHPGFAEKLQYEVSRQFQLDRRVQYVTPGQEEGLVYGKVRRYLLEPLVFDPNNVPVEYKFWVLVDVVFQDRATGKNLWVEPRMSSEVNYKVIGSTTNISTQQEAEQFVIDQLSKDIVKRTIDGWFAASGISHRKE